jgi:GlpG protein
VFLHFGWLHIAFNSLWCWELGRRIEGALGSVNLAGLFLVTAVLSNTISTWYRVPCSSAVFPAWSTAFSALPGSPGRLNPRWQGLAPATPIMLFMVGWLVICLLGVFDVLGFSVANGAHVGGLVTGACSARCSRSGFRGAGRVAVTAAYNARPRQEAPWTTSS